jgi:hypothetical protein
MTDNTTAVDLPRFYLRLGAHETLKRRYTLALGPE